MTTKRKLVSNWRQVLMRSWTVWLAAIGAFLPEVLEIAAENIASVPLLDDGQKSIIRLVCLVLIPMARVIRQPSVPKDAP